jgi:hypothetical protein
VEISIRNTVLIINTKPTFMHSTIATMTKNAISPWDKPWTQFQRDASAVATFFAPFDSHQNVAFQQAARSQRLAGRRSADVSFF